MCARVESERPQFFRTDCVAPGCLNGGAYAFLDLKHVRNEKPLTNALRPEHPFRSRCWIGDSHRRSADDPMNNERTSMTHRPAAANSVQIGRSSVGRRRVLAGSCAALATALLPSIGLASETPLQTLQGLSQRRLKLDNPRTLEKLDLVYWFDGGYDPAALRAVNWFMRDFRAEATIDIDRGLLDLICSMHRATESSEPFTILSGYRSAKTNDLLIRQGAHAAEHSFHIEGKAVDLRMPGFSTKGLKYLARSLQIGGIGYYPRDGFLHLDTGPIRSWQG